MKKYVRIFVLLIASVIGFSACTGSTSQVMPVLPIIPVTYSVTISPCSNGSITANKTSGISAGETITLTVTPAVTADDDFKLASLSVKNGDSEVSVNNYSFTMPAANVTVTAAFNRIAYLGSKKPSKAKEVGDIVFNDGSSMPYSVFAALNDNEKNEKKTSAIAVIFYKGTELNSDAADGTPDNTTSRTLGVGLKHDETDPHFCENFAQAYNIKITTIVCLIYKNSGELAQYDDGSELTFSGDKNGSDNLEQIEAFEGIDDTAIPENYPAFYYGKNYARSVVTNIPVASEFARGWYLPSLPELYQLYVNCKGANKVFDIDAVLDALGGDKFEDLPFQSSTQTDARNGTTNESRSVYRLGFDNLGAWQAYSKDHGNVVVCIREFN